MIFVNGLHAIIFLPYAGDNNLWQNASMTKLKESDILFDAYLQALERMKLEHFCAQYDEWKESLLEIDPYPNGKKSQGGISEKADPTYAVAVKRLSLENRMKLVEDTAALIDIGKDIFVAVTEERTFGYFEALGRPYGRDLFYDRLRQFYFLLDKVRT